MKKQPCHFELVEKFILFTIFVLLPQFFLSCSSAPKRIMLVTDTRDLSYSQLDGANLSLSEENYERAFNQLNSAYNLALSVDNTELLCKISLSAIILKINCKNLSELIPAINLKNSSEAKSFLAQSKEEILQDAKKFASRSDEADKKFLSDLCVIYDVKIQLANDTGKNYASLLEGVKATVSKEPYYSAFLERTLGDVFMADEKYSDACLHYEEAAKIHTKNRYLLEIGTDYYSASRAYSQNGQKKEAVSAIKMALKYDKDAENTLGIVADYLAYSKILLKGNPTEEEKLLSAELLKWSEKIAENTRN